MERGYDHPIAIAPVRVAHILSRLDLRAPGKRFFILKRKDEKERAPVISTDSLYAIAEGVSKALAEANPGQQVVVQSIRNDTSLLVFDHDYLTDFVAYVKDDLLYIHFNHWEWEIPSRRKDRLPEPHPGKHPQEFSLLPSRAMTLVDGQSVAVHWRDPIFRRPTRTRITPGGKVVRKTILMEMEGGEVAPDLPADEAPIPTDSLPANLRPGTLRDLADLEERRRAGLVTEMQYEMERREILEADPATE